MNYCELADGAVTITLSRSELEEVAELLLTGTGYDDGPVLELIELAFPTEDEL